LAILPLLPSVHIPAAEIEINMEFDQIVYVVFLLEAIREVLLV
jgi:hypothetical protein